MTKNFLTALPVFNEEKYVDSVLDEVLKYSSNVLVVDDGSTDGTRQKLARRTDVRTVSHPRNLGYGAALQTAFRYAAEQQFDTLVTIDCDGQHEPVRIPRFVRACRDVDIVSGSRYLKQYPDDDAPPAQRQWINCLITADLNRQLGLSLTDAFCGFKAYRVRSLSRLQLTETGYAMPLQLWVQAAAAGFKVLELPVPLIYLDPNRSFGNDLDDADKRLAYYQQVIARSLTEAALTGPLVTCPAQAN